MFIAAVHVDEVIRIYLVTYNAYI